ncbi:Hypothetical_protein [Hexamita inflata]|uniref:Hypothetical_protein n=1 Tax=Hexamita inflata TaxID=28002 RepID=A0AA86RTV7_9EUKA|nr:Hypothetical protein HINF_LOCUS65469 [Hexamita inflata]
MNSQSVCMCDTQNKQSQKLVNSQNNYSQSSSSYSEEQLLQQISSDGQPIEFICKRKYKAENVFSNTQFRAIIINSLHTYMEPQEISLKETLKDFSDQQLCEIVNSMGKYFWDIVIAQQGHNLQQVKNYYTNVFRKNK